MMDKIQDILQKHVAQGEDTTNKLLGASFVVVKKDAPSQEFAAGRIGFDTASNPFSADTFTWVASLTKIITTTCIMRVQERGFFHLEDDMRVWVPELGKMQVLRGFDDDGKALLESHNTPITMRMLLTHTIGLVYDLEDPDMMKWSASVGRTTDANSGTREGFNTALKFPPGKGWCYGTSVDWAGFALEKIAGRKLSEIMKKEVFDPLGMRDTTFWPEKIQGLEERTPDFAVRSGEGLVQGGGPEPSPTRNIESGGAGLFTTARDYATFLRALMEGKMVRTETLTEMLRPQLDEPQSGHLAGFQKNDEFRRALCSEYEADTKTSYGLGGMLNLEDLPGKRAKGSMAWCGLVSSRWWMDVETGVAAVLIVNVAPMGDPVVNQLYDELERAVYQSLRSEETSIASS